MLGAVVIVRLVGIKMKDLIVDENYPGLVDGGWCWKLSGSLVAEGSLTCIALNAWRKQNEMAMRFL